MPISQTIAEKRMYPTASCFGICQLAYKFSNIAPRTSSAFQGIRAAWPLVWS